MMADCLACNLQAAYVTPQLAPHDPVCACKQGRHWVLDPIDGTRGFVGLRQYAICLGLLDHGQVTLPQ